MAMAVETKQKQPQKAVSLEEFFHPDRQHIARSFDLVQARCPYCKEHMLADAAQHMQEELKVLEPQHGNTATAIKHCKPYEIAMFMSDDQNHLFMHTKCYEAMNEERAANAMQKITLPDSKLSADTKATLLQRVASTSNGVMAMALNPAVRRIDLSLMYASTEKPVIEPLRIVCNGNYVPSHEYLHGFLSFRTVSTLHLTVRSREWQGALLNGVLPVFKKFMDKLSRNKALARSMRMGVLVVPPRLEALEETGRVAVKVMMLHRMVDLEMSQLWSRVVDVCANKVVNPEGPSGAALTFLHQTTSQKVDTYTRKLNGLLQEAVTRRDIQHPAVLNVHFNSADTVAVRDSHSTRTGSGTGRLRAGEREYYLSTAVTSSEVPIWVPPGAWGNNTHPLTLCIQPRVAEVLGDTLMPLYLTTQAEVEQFTTTLRALCRKQAPEVDTVNVVQQNCSFFFKPSEGLTRALQAELDARAARALEKQKTT